ncbi:hypothetical protein N7489_007467 [Penicillium chrysogenum]|uniref:uncharacterized protein n=1 Tax=Penicillium chrysogenum TaxID=5076 RepID=UPI0023921967|nr:uncharacterized protein N7489_007467 [Penicillium chrysogenum]KAJ5237376.1 hypothetical protein N7489_007467 [Penicillium chrysogenum]KAJ5277334.1 hypothetical protein N7524_003487 [Penicillium chrysogenum]
MSIIRKRFASPNQYSWDAATAHKASRLSRLRRPQVALVIDELQRVVQDPVPVKPRLLYELDDGLLCSAQADGDHWLCIPDTTKDEIFDIVHGGGYLDFYRDIRELRSFARTSTSTTSERRTACRATNLMDRFSLSSPSQYHSTR